MADDLAKVAEDSARGSFFLITGSAIQTVILAIASVLVARLLGSELYGQYTLALVVPQLLFLFTDLGINQGIIKFAASLRAKGETARLVQMVKHGLLLRTLVGVTVFMLNYILADQFSLIIQRPDLVFYLRIASISIPFHVLWTTAGSVFIGLDKTEYNALATNVQAISKAIVSSALVVLGFSVAGAIIGHVVSYVAAAMSALFVALLIVRSYPDQKASMRFLDSIRGLMHFGAPLYIVALIVGFIPLYQSLVLANFTTDALIGNYKAAGNFVAILAVLSVPITTALLPAFSKLDGAKSGSASTFFRLATKYTSMAVLPITMLIIAFSSEIVGIIYGSTFDQASTFLALLCLVYLLSGIGHLAFGSFFNGLGETRTTLKMSLLALVILVPLSPLLTGMYSVEGLIIASLLANVGASLYGLHIARSEFHVKLDFIPLLKIYMVSITSCVPPVLLVYIIRTQAIIALVLGSLLYLLAYATLVPLTRAVTSTELQTIIHVVRNIRPLNFFATPVLRFEQRILRMVEHRGEG